MTLSVGDEAPGFEVNIDGDGKFSLEGAKGSNVILYFIQKMIPRDVRRKRAGFGTLSQIFQRLMRQLWAFQRILWLNTINSNQNTDYPSSWLPMKMALYVRRMAHGWRNRCTGRNIWV